MHRHHGDENRRHRWEGGVEGVILTPHRQGSDVASHRRQKEAGHAFPPAQLPRRPVSARRFPPRTGMPTRTRHATRATGNPRFGGFDFCTVGDVRVHYVWPRTPQPRLTTPTPVPEPPAPPARRLALRKCRGPADRKARPTAPAAPPPPPRHMPPPRRRPGHTLGGARRRPFPATAGDAEPYTANVLPSCLCNRRLVTSRMPATQRRRARLRKPTTPIHNPLRPRSCATFAGSPGTVLPDRAAAYPPRFWRDPKATSNPTPDILP
jgi:hypothetical protein